MKRIALLVLATAALIAAGCGDSGEKNEYVDEVNKVASTLQSTLNDVGEEVENSTDEEGVASKLDDGADALDAAADDLSKVDAPSDAENATDDMVAGLRDLADEFREGADDARAGDLDAVTERFSSIETSAGADKITAAQKQLEEAGYEFKDDNS